MEAWGGGVADEPTVQIVPRQDPEGDLDPDLSQVVPDHFPHQPGQRGGAHLQAEAIRIPGGGQQGAGAGDVALAGRELVVEAEDLRRDQLVGRPGQAVETAPDDLLAVQGEVDGLPDRLLCQRIRGRAGFLGDVQGHQHHRDGAGHLRAVSGFGVDPGHVLPLQASGQIHLARQQGRHTLPRLVNVGDLNLREDCRPAPVAVEPLQQETPLRQPVVELIGTGTHRLVGQGGILEGGGPGHDVGEGELVQEQRIGLPGLDLDPQGIQGVHPPNAGEVRTDDRAIVRGRPLDGVGDVLGLERPAVVEPHAGPELEQPVGGVGIGPGLGQGGLDLQVGVEAHQAFENVAEGAPGGAFVVQMGVEREQPAFQREAQDRRRAGQRRALPGQGQPDAQGDGPEAGHDQSDDANPTPAHAIPACPPNPVRCPRTIRRTNRW